MKQDERWSDLITRLYEMDGDMTSQNEDESHHGNITTQSSVCASLRDPLGSVWNKETCPRCMIFPQPDGAISNVDN